MNDLFTPEITADGSFTFFSKEFDEAFHSHYGAAQEAIGKFVVPCQLEQLTRIHQEITILDICYGLGYNTAAALAAIWQVNPDCRVQLIALEADGTVPKSAIAHHLLDRWNPELVDKLAILADLYQFKNERLQMQLLIGDARQTIQELARSPFLADAIFLDPFSPPKCPQLWTVEFLALVAQCLKPTGTLATYSCAASVRTALQLAGLKIGASESVGRRSPGTIARYQENDLPALSLQEQEHLKTRAAIPYRDPLLQDSATEILQRRTIEQQDSQLEPSSHWKKRWLN
jgi:tRNA U34 5-methylaminomethyl-2-thiouridine-forming methyltransferase MnmC